MQNPYNATSRLLAFKAKFNLFYMPSHSLTHVHMSTHNYTTNSIDITNQKPYLAHCQPFAQAGHRHHCRYKQYSLTHPNLRSLTPQHTTTIIIKAASNIDTACMHGTHAHAMPCTMWPGKHTLIYSVNTATTAHMAKKHIVPNAAPKRTDWHLATQYTHTTIVATAIPMTRL